MKPLMVTGTDTGVGKTYVTTALVRALRHQGLNPWPIKPVETGCVDRTAPEDGLALARAAGCEHALDRVCPYRFSLPASPWTAARAEGRELTVGHLVDAVNALPTEGTVRVVEGAGGWLVPITEHHTFADLAVALQSPVLVVVRDALGTLNHTLLTVEAIHRRGLTVAAVVVNAVAEGTSPLDHMGDLQRLLPGVSVLGTLPRVVTETPAARDHKAMDSVEALGVPQAVLRALG